ncbi:MAG: transposase-like protein [Bacteriovoracaceae bacterium]|jgi:transposase-like protein
MNTKSTSRLGACYGSYDPELKRIVAETQNIDIAIKRGVPRTTAIYWASKGKGISYKRSCAEVYLEEEIGKLKKKLENERAKNLFLKEVAIYVPVIKDKRKRVSIRIKKALLRKIEEFKKYAFVSDLLKLIGLHYSTYMRWRADLAGCKLTLDGLCGKRRDNQLTGDEAMQILKLGTSKKFSHFSLTALWKYAYRHGIVVCSIDTWFKYVALFGIKRVPTKGKKIMYDIGVRAKKPNEIWHLDLTYLKLRNGNNVYLQVIIDNYSRYIVNWKLFDSRTAENTYDLLNEAKGKLTKNLSTEVYMDSGGENKNKLVDKIFWGKNLKRVFAKVDVKYSNSIVEAFFRSIKNNYLYEGTFKNMEALRREVAFYVKSHNLEIPHSAFEFQTPLEMYKGDWSAEKTQNIREEKERSLERRVRVNRTFASCSTCVS